MHESHEAKSNDPPTEGDPVRHGGSAAPAESGDSRGPSAQPLDVTTLTPSAVGRLLQGPSEALVWLEHAYSATRDEHYESLIDSELHRVFMALQYASCGIEGDSLLPNELGNLQRRRTTTAIGASYAGLLEDSYKHESTARGECALLLRWIEGQRGARHFGLLQAHAKSVPVQLKASAGALWRIGVRLQALARPEPDVGPATTAVTFTAFTEESRPQTVEGSEKGALVGVFRHVDSIWTLDFAGVTKSMPNKRGFWYIQRLLAQPHREIAVDVLHRAVEKADLRTSTFEAPRDGGECSSASGQLMKEQPIADSHAIAEYKRVLSDLAQRREEAQESGDQDHLRKIARDEAALKREMRQATGLGGRQRTFQSARSRMRTGVGNAMERALVRLREGHPPLHDHLRESLRKVNGASPMYSPNPDVVWMLD